MPIRYFYIDVKLEGIRIFLHRAFNVDDEYVQTLDKEYSEKEWDEYGEAEHDQSTDALLAYQEIVTRAALGEMNAVIELGLKGVAKSIQIEHKSEASKVERQMDRGRACRLIETEYGIKLNDLPGFPEVDEIRRIVNAYKHDDGYSSEYEPFFVGYKEKKYELSPSQAEKYLDAVKEFLHALPGGLSSYWGDARVKL
jgi:hypothetical protein